MWLVLITLKIFCWTDEWLFNKFIPTKGTSMARTVPSELKFRILLTLSVGCFITEFLNFSGEKFGKIFSVVLRVLYLPFIMFFFETTAYSRDFCLKYLNPSKIRSSMPGLPPRLMGHYFTRKKMLDWELLSTIAYQVFFLKRALSLRVVERRYFEARRTYIPYKDFGYPDLVSYLHTIKGLSITINSTNGQYQVEADEDQQVFNVQEMFFFPDEEGNV